MVFDEAFSIDKIKDGTTNTIIVAEDSGRGASLDGEWANGENIFDQGQRINQHNHNEIWSDHPGGAHVLLCDGSVHFLNQTLEVDVLTALCTRAGGEPNASISNQ